MTIVDDQCDARDLGVGVLMECNAEVFRAGGGNQALQLIEREPLHVVASDIDMPDVNGYELVRRVRALGQGKGRLPIVALTALRTR